MLVAVTGASGHVGANLVRALIARGNRVRVLVHDDARGIEGLDVERVKGDVRDADSVRPFVRGVDRVFHMAAKISLDPKDGPLLEAINVGGVRNVAEACLAEKVRMVHTSSIHALSSEPMDKTIDETRPLASGPRALPYDRSKAAGERVIAEVAAKGLDVVTVNPTAVLGPYDFRPSHMGEVLLDLYHGRLPGLVEGAFDWVDVRDVVAGALAASEKGRRGERYLLGGAHRTVPELAKIVAEVTGRRAPRLVSPMWLARGVAPFATVFAKIVNRRPLFTSASLTALSNHRSVSHAKAERELGYSSRPLVDTIRDTFAWFREAGMLES